MKCLGEKKQDEEEKMWERDFTTGESSQGESTSRKQKRGKKKACGKDLEGERRYFSLSDDTRIYFSHLSATQAEGLANGLGRHERHKPRESLRCYLQPTLSDLLY